MSTTPSTHVLHIATVAPPPPLPGAGDQPSSLLLPLSYFDLIWLHAIPIRRLLFYHCACSKSDFLATILPQLNQSLSITLRHYLPVAGNLLYPTAAAHDDFDDDDSISIKPFIRYVPGDAVPLTVAESASDFDDIIAHHPRDADQFYEFTPQMPPITQQGEYSLVPLLALQVTLFPDRGICIGFANHHSLGDASSIFRFISAWAEINKLGGEGDHASSSLPPPIFDRSVINDPLGIDSIFWKVMRKIPLQGSSFPLPTGRVRATYTLHPSHIKHLKNLVLAKNPGLSQVSSFVVTAAYIWTCFLSSGDAIGEEVGASVEEYFIFPADARGKVDPPVPANYFGNCLSGGRVKLEHGELVEEEKGFTSAAEAIAEEIRKRVNNKDEVLKGAENWMSHLEDIKRTRSLRVSGSPRFDLCGADFGWGRAKKLEVVSIDGEKYSMSLCRSGVCEGGLEVGLSLPKDWMDAFAPIFANGLPSLSTFPSN